MLLQASFGLLRENQFESATEGFMKYLETTKMIEDDQTDREELFKALDTLASEHFRE